MASDGHATGVHQRMDIKANATRDGKAGERNESEKAAAKKEKKDKRAAINISRQVTSLKE